MQLLKTAKPKCIMIEATGGLERLLVEALVDAQLPVWVVNPSRVRHLVVALNQQAKNDPIDAFALSEFTRLTEP